MGKQGKYYCLPGIGDDNKSRRLSKPFRIAFIYESFPFIPSGIEGYSTLEELREKDQLWRKYFEQDQKSAQKICEEKFIMTPMNFVICPTDKEFDKVSYKLLKHTVMGELQKEITGIHLLSNLNKSIISVKEKSKPDRFGVWIADIEYRSSERGRTYIKENSTMFPRYWDPTTFMFKIYKAYNIRKQCQTHDWIYHSITDCGIRVDFVMRDHLINSVYPVYESS